MAQFVGGTAAEYGRPLMVLRFIDDMLAAGPTTPPV